MTNPIEILNIKTRDFEIDGFCFGSGSENLVILPGIGLKSITNSAGGIASMYKPLAEKFKIFVLDRRSIVPDGFSVENMAEDTAAAMESLGLSRAAVFGASLGGMIAQTLAINRPDLVSALVLGSTTSRCNPTIRSVALEWASDAEKGDIASLVKKYTQNLYTERTAKLFGEMLLQLNSDLSGEELKRFAAQARAITSFDIYGKLDKIKAPTLVIGVEGDKVVSGEASTEIAEKIGCELYMYGREYAHCVFDEAPDYKNRLLSFFEKTKTIEKKLKL